MSQFNYQDELQKFIKNKQLVQVHFVETPNEFRAGYLLAASPEFITMAEITDAGNFDGINMYLASTVEIIKTESVYLDELAKHILTDHFYADYQPLLRNIDQFTFTGFIAALENTDIVADIEYGQVGGRGGKVVDYDDEVVVFDEYRTESRGRLARSFVKISSIKRITVGAAWLRVLSRALFDNTI